VYTFSTVNKGVLGQARFVYARIGLSFFMEKSPQFDSAVTCPVCGASIPTVKMDTRFIARYRCPNCQSEVLIHEKPGN
jgi:DNA-directed RNA polymerase subunit RPC12/RpoP